MFPASTLFFETKSLAEPGACYFLGLLDSEPPGSFCFYPTSAGLQVHATNAWLLCGCWAIWTSTQMSTLHTEKSIYFRDQIFPLQVLLECSQGMLPKHFMTPGIKSASHFLLPGTWHQQIHSAFWHMHLHEAYIQGSWHGSRDHHVLASVCYSSWLTSDCDFFFEREREWGKGEDLKLWIAKLSRIILNII